MPATSLAIETSRLTRYDGLRRSVASVSLAVPAGALLGLLGPPGAGKSTLIRLLAGRLCPASGRGAIFGHDLRRERRAVRALTSVVTAVPPLIGSLSLRANLRLLAVLRGQGAAAPVDMALRRVDLEARAGAPAREAANAERWRLAIAAALLHRPRLLFLDEPTVDLDPAGVAALHRVLRGLHGEGLTLALASQRVEEVERLCTHVALLREGHLLAYGPIEDFLRGEDALLITAEPLPIVAAVAAHFGYEALPAGRGALRVAAGPEAAPGLIAALVSAGARVFEVTAERRGLARCLPELETRKER
ncbi:MAG: ABC transporter ATP-binding protein [Oscillochloridaceae bacterium]|nr:ABC transporter ATP-binding protein [Chloroflexaceae bacterium]MDW8390607.1 ABC transporter ATP-binding protein [Oscillochloridaceae bacterium]